MELFNEEEKVVGARVHNDDQVSVSVLQKVGQNHIIRKVQNDIVLRCRSNAALTLNFSSKMPQTQTLMKDPFVR